MMSGLPVLQIDAYNNSLSVVDSFSSEDDCCLQYQTKELHIKIIE